MSWSSTIQLRRSPSAWRSTQPTRWTQDTFLGASHGLMECILWEVPCLSELKSHNLTLMKNKKYLFPWGSLLHESKVNLNNSFFSVFFLSIHSMFPYSVCSLGHKCSFKEVRPLHTLYPSSLLCWWSNFQHKGLAMDREQNCQDELH